MQRNLPLPNSPSSNQVNLLEYIEVVVKRWRMIGKITLVGFIASIGIAFWLPKIYSSTTMILPPQQDSGMMGMMNAMTGGMASLAGDLLGKGTTSDLYVGILNSRAIQDAIIDRFKLVDVYEKKYRLDTYKVLDKMTEVSAGKKDGIISITVQDKDPKRAAAMANAFVEELGKLTVKLNITGAGQNRGYLQERLAAAKVDLGRAEDALKKFQSANKALDVPEQAKASIMSVANLKAQLAVQEVQLATMRSRFTDSDQGVRDLRASVVNLRSQISQVEGNGRGSSIPSVGSVPQLGQDYVRLMREYKVQETLVELLTKQYEIAKISEANEVDGVQIIQKATVPDKKIKPKRTIIVLGITLVACFGAVLYAFFLHAFGCISPENRQRCNMIREMLPKVFRST